MRAALPAAGSLLAGLAGVVAAAGLTACSLLAPPDPDPQQRTDGPALPSETGPVDLADPIEFAIVEETGQAPCSGDYVPSSQQDECLLLGDGMTITEVEELAMATPMTQSGTASDEEVLHLVMTSQDGADFYELTSRAAELPEPRIAMAVDGEVVSAPMLDQAVPGGAIEVAGWDGAEEFVAQATTG